MSCKSWIWAACNLLTLATRVLALWTAMQCLVRAVVVILVIALEVLRDLHTWFMKKAYSNSFDTSKPAPLLDLIWARTSPVIGAQQVLSHMLAGKHSRLTLLVHFCGCKTLHQCMVKYPSLSRLLRRLLHLAHATIERRHGQSDGQHRSCLFDPSDSWVLD